MNIQDPVESGSFDQCRAELSPPLVAIIAHRGGQPASLGSLSPVIELDPGLARGRTGHYIGTLSTLSFQNIFGLNFFIAPKASAEGACI